MSKMVLHQARNRPNIYGGTTYGTLCGRMNAASQDGMNVADEGFDPTCKFCLRQLEITKRLRDAKEKREKAALTHQPEENR